MRLVFFFRVLQIFALRLLYSFEFSGIEILRKVQEAGCATWLWKNLSSLFSLSFQLGFFH